MEMIQKAMKLRILKRFGPVGLAALLALTVMLILQLGSSARATQSEESESQGKGLQGTWRVQLTVRDCQTGAALRTFPALFTFDKGGTLSVTTAGQLPALSTTGLGVWRHTDGHAYSAVSEAFVFSTAGVWTQTHRLTRAIEIGDNKDEFTDTVGLQIFDTNGNVIVTGCATSAGSRFE
jgi:hypothetical protein